MGVLIESTVHHLLHGPYDSIVVRPLQVDEVPLSRPKRNIARDFSDGVLVAEIVAHYFPKLVEMHNYPPANSYAQKIYNW